MFSRASSLVQPNHQRHPMDQRNHLHEYKHYALPDGIGVRNGNRCLSRHVGGRVEMATTPKVRDPLIFKPLRVRMEAIDSCMVFHQSQPTPPPTDWSSAHSRTEPAEPSKLATGASRQDQQRRRPQRCSDAARPAINAHSTTEQHSTAWRTARSSWEERGNRDGGNNGATSGVRPPC